MPPVATPINTTGIVPTTRAPANGANGANGAPDTVREASTKKAVEEAYQEALKKRPLGPVVDVNFENGFKLITLISPFFLVFLLVTISIINSDIKGFVYLGGVIFLFTITYFFNKAVQSNDLEGTCAFWNIGLFKTPSFISALYVYTIVYLLYPMMINQVFNFPLIIILLLIYIFDIIIRSFKMGCTNIIHVTLGSVLGLLFALFFIMLLANNKELLYYNDMLSSKVACSIPSKQKFKCSVYNNGQLIQSIDPN
jgi:hypothetical protein